MTAATPQPTEFYYWADRLLACAAASLTAHTAAGAPERRHVAVGQDLIWDDCECDLLVVQVPRIFLSDTFPIVKQTGPFNRCHGAIFTVVQYHVNILRCVASPQGRESAPAPAAMNDDAIKDLSDRWAIRRGVECCLAAEAEVRPGTAPLYLLGEHLAQGEGGNCAGSQLPVMVALKNCVDCSPEPEPWAVPG